MQMITCGTACCTAQTNLLSLLNMIAGNADAVINDKPVTDYIIRRISRSLKAACT